MFLLVSLDDCGGQDWHPDLITLNVSTWCYSHLLCLRCWMEPKQDCLKALRHKDRFHLANIICRFNVSYWNRGDHTRTMSMFMPSSMFISSVSCSVSFFFAWNQRLVYESCCMHLFHIVQESLAHSCFCCLDQPV